MQKDNRPLIAVMGSCMAIFWSGALTFGFPGVMAPLWQEMFSVGGAETGLTISFMLAAVGIFMFLVGRWQERLGLSRTMAAGVVLTAIASVLVSSAASIETVYAWAALNGMASSFIYVPALTLVQWCYPNRRGLFTGIVSMVFGLSAGIMSPVFAEMLELLGYRSLNLTVAFLTLTIGLFGANLARASAGWMMASQIRPTAATNEGRAGSVRGHEETEKKNAMGQVASGQVTSDNVTSGRAESAVAVSDRVESERAASSTIVILRRSFTVRESLRTRSFQMLWATWTLAGAAGVSMTVLATGYGLHLGYPLHSSILMLTAFNLTNGLSRIASGMLSDRFSRTGVMSAAFFAAGLGYLALPWTGDLFACAILAAVIGFSFGTLFSVSAPLVADCFGLDHFGAIFGLTFAAYGFVAGPLGPALSGHLLDLTGGDYTPVFLYLGAFSILASICIRRVVPPRIA